jgi:hypothetical protein
LIYANPMPRKSPHWPVQQLGPMGATNREQVGHVQPTDALPSLQLTMSEVATTTKKRSRNSAWVFEN